MKTLTYFLWHLQGQTSLITLASLGFMIDPPHSVRLSTTLKMATWNLKRAGKDRQRLIAIFFKKY